MISPGIPIKQSLSDPTDEAALRRIWAGVQSRFPPRPAFGRRRVALGMAALVGTSAVVVALLRADSGPLRMADGRPIPVVEAPASAAELPLLVALSDASRIALSPGTRIEPLESTRTTFAAMLVRGAARFDVRSGGSRRWILECGLATVEVVGTIFRIERQPGRLRVAVDRGAVLVRGERVPNRVRRLGAGESLDVFESEASVVPTPAALAPAVPASPDGETTPSGPPAQLRRSGEASTGRQLWRELARSGRHGEAFSSLGTEGVRRESRRLGADDLLALADVARLSGHPIEAVVPLERVLSEFPADPQAPLAAFALGRLELDTLRRPARAARAFDRAVALGVPASLKEDVMARLVEAFVRANERSAATAAAGEYDKNFPHGRHGRAIRGWLAEP